MTRTETLMFEALLNGLEPEEKPVLKVDPATWSNEQFMQWQVDTYNSTVKEPQDGYNCTACKNRGYFALINAAGDFALRACTCNNVRTQIRNASNSGFGDMLDKYTFEAYEAKETWQKTVKQDAIRYTEQKELSWLYIGGMSGAGKSHICTAAATKILKQGKVVKYVLWRDIYRKGETYKFNADQYDEFMKELGDVEVLVIDDFLKNIDINRQGAALEIAFDLINRRYNSNKATIISSEYHLDDIENLDKALCGRIKERCGSFVLNIKNEDNRNHRKGDKKSRS